MARKIIIINFKGGVGKTVSSLSITAALAKNKKRVLLIDNDPESHLTKLLRIYQRDSVNTIYGVYKGQKELKDILIKANNYYVAPSHKDLAGALVELNDYEDKNFILKNAIEPLADYFDYIIIDSASQYNLFSVNGFIASKEVFICCQPEYLSLSALNDLIDTVKRCAIPSRNPDLKITGAFCTLFHTRRSSNREAYELLGKHYPDITFKTIIRNTVELADFPSHGIDIFQYKPFSSGARDFLKLTSEIIKQEK